jgi:hypothetical protein
MERKKRQWVEQQRNFRKLLHVLSNLLNSCNLKVFSISVARFMFQIQLISDDGLYFVVTIPRLQDIVADGKRWN